MRYFKNPNDNNNVYGYDDSDSSQDSLIQNAIKNKWEEVTDSWPPVPTKEQKISNYEAAAQLHLDQTAQSWGYDSLLIAASYTTSTNAQYKADAEALIAWRDSYWTEAYTLEAGTLPATAEAFVALLPEAPSKPVI